MLRSTQSIRHRDAFQLQNRNLMGIFNACHDGLKGSFKGQSSGHELWLILAPCEFISHAPDAFFPSFLSQYATSCFLFFFHFNAIWLIYVPHVLPDLCFPPYTPQISIFISRSSLLSTSFLSHLCISILFVLSSLISSVQFCLMKYSTFQYII